MHQDLCTSDILQLSHHANRGSHALRTRWHQVGGSSLPEKQTIQIETSKPGHLVGLFAFGSDLSGIPSETITRDEAREMVGCGDAVWVNKARAVQRKRPNSYSLRSDLGAGMPALVTVKAAEGSHRHKELAAFWSPHERKLRYVRKAA